MSRSTKYGIRELHKDFPTGKACLEYVFDSLHKRACSCGGTYSLRLRRKVFQCGKCRLQISPTAGTIFHKSSTPLLLWFHALMVFSNAKSGIAAKQMERHLAVTYKCAWRMLSLIRKSLQQFGERLKKEVESDGAYFGGRKNAGKNNERLSQAVRAKTVVLGALERGGNMRASVVPNLEAGTIESFIVRNVSSSSSTLLLTDGAKGYKRLARDYDHHSVDHHRGEYVRGYVHVNSMENFWSHSKRSITGVHKSISKRHAQSYLNAFVFHYNNRHNDRARFEALLGMLLLASPKK
jgi:transposase